MGVAQVFRCNTYNNAIVPQCRTATQVAQSRRSGGVVKRYQCANVLHERRQSIGALDKQQSETKRLGRHTGSGRRRSTHNRVPK